MTAKLLKHAPVGAVVGATVGASVGKRVVGDTVGTIVGFGVVGPVVGLSVGSVGDIALLLQTLRKHPSTVCHSATQWRQCRSGPYVGLAASTLGCPRSFSGLADHLRPFDETCLDDLGNFCAWFVSVRPCARASARVRAARP